MKFLERSYSGKYFRPTPEILCEPENGLLIITTPWGPRQGAKKISESIRDFLMSVIQDQEVTSPFQKLTCVSPMANNLRAAIMLANDMIYREENGSEYNSGYELCVLFWNRQECVWAQIGQPQIFLDRHPNYLTALSSSTDLAGAHSADLKASLAPLPSQLLGLYSTSNFSVHGFKPLPGDQLILTSRSFITPYFLAATKNERRLEELSRRLSKDNVDMPFWLASLQLDQNAG